MLKIRLQRVGRKHEPAFRLVLTDSKNSTKSGRFKEILGSYDPRKTNEVLDAERIKHWISVGAQPTDTVHNLLVEKKVIEGEKRNVLPKKTPPVKEAPVEEVAPAEEATEGTPAPAEEKPEEVSSEEASDEKQDTNEDAGTVVEEKKEEPAEEPQA